MSYRIKPTFRFQKETKVLAKKYPSLKVELMALGQSLAENPRQGSFLGKTVTKFVWPFGAKEKDAAEVPA